MTLLDAHPYDPATARRRKIKITVTVVIVVALASLAWMYRNWPEEHSVDKFFAALQRQDYETAYASTHTRTSIATGDQAASGVSSSPTGFTDRPTQKVLAAEGS